MLLQQFGGASAMAYYTSSIFEKAGILAFSDIEHFWWSKTVRGSLKENDNTNAWFCAGASSSIGSRGIAIIQVLSSFL